MSSALFCPLRRFFHLIFLLLATIPVLGCGDSSGVGVTFPVSGKMTFNNEPLTAKTTRVWFKPDASKGNTSPFDPVGTVDAAGSYTLTTQGKNGAPPGWYQVVVTAWEDAAPVHPQGPRKRRPVAKSLLPSKFGQPQTSGLAIEVVENPAPGAYDLKLSN